LEHAVKPIVAAKSPQLPETPSNDETRKLSVSAATDQDLAGGFEEFASKLISNFSGELLRSTLVSANDYPSYYGCSPIQQLIEEIIKFP
jgi:hypothetical protein